MRGLTEVFEGLTAEYKQWCVDQGLRSDLSADELAAEDVTRLQWIWLTNFIDRWNEACSEERKALNL